MKLWEDPRVSNISSKLKKVRILRKLTQEELADLSGVNLKSLSSYEQNIEKFSNASVSTVIKLANALNCDITDIINSETIKD